MTLVATQLEDPPRAITGLAHVGVIVPTCNAEPHWNDLRYAIDAQGIDPDQVVIIDSSSADNTPLLARRAGYKFAQIERCDFSHGGTRRQAAEYLPSADILLYLTQDALPANPDSFRNLCAAFDDPILGAAYGRQIPRPEAGPIERHARLFNYPLRSSVRTFGSRHEVGIKAAFLSNSFAAYRRSALEQVGGFPTDVIMAEDSLVAARLLLAGWSIGYIAQAAVVHSHPLSLTQEFGRYFDTGVHHARERWILDAFGDAGQEGVRFLRSEVAYLRSNRPTLLPVAFLRTFSKFLAYHLGRHEHRLPLSIKTSLSSQPAFWLRALPGQQPRPGANGLPHLAEQSGHRPIRP